MARGSSISCARKPQNMIMSYLLILVSVEYCSPLLECARGSVLSLNVTNTHTHTHTHTHTCIPTHTSSCNLIPPPPFPPSLLRTHVPLPSLLLQRSKAGPVSSVQHPARLCSGRPRHRLLPGTQLPHGDAAHPRKLLPSITTLIINTRLLRSGSKFLIPRAEFLEFPQTTQHIMQTCCTQSV